jgi:hypothetical protein
MRVKGVSRYGMCPDDFEPRLPALAAGWGSASNRSWRHLARMQDLSERSEELMAAAWRMRTCTKLEFA